MANCSTVQKKRGLKPHPGRTPQVMLNFQLRPDDPMTFPYCQSYDFEIIQTMCCEMPCSRKLFHKVLANGHDQMFLTNLRWQPTLAYQQPRFYPGRYLRSSGVLQCVSHDGGCVAPPDGGHQVDVQFLRNKTCKCIIKNKRMLAMGRKSVSCVGRTFIAQHVT